MKKETCAAIVVAAGSATRMRGIDKALAPIGGVPMLLRTVSALAESEKIDEIIVVTRSDLIEAVTELCRSEAKFSQAVCGGSTRTESVMNGLSAAKTDLVAIHDGARPFITAEIIDRTVAAAKLHGAAAPAIALKDTVKFAQNGVILSTPDRSTLFAVQTPQVFYTDAIYAALSEATKKNIPLTDDCSAMEAMGKPVILTEGSDENIKITTPIDLAFAEAIVKRRDTL